MLWVGDTVEIREGKYKGHISQITQVGGTRDVLYPYVVDGASGWIYAPHQLRLVCKADKKKESMSKKYYRVIKDHPLWEVGAILEKQDDGYALTDDFWNKDFPGDHDFSGYTEDRYLVENQPEWFERVYEMSHLGKLVYLTKEEAKAQAAKFFKPKKDK